MWSGSQRSLNYGLGPDMGMVGLRDVFVVAPASSFNPQNDNHHHHHHHHPSLISDPHSSTTLGVGVGVIPLLTAGPCLAQPHMGLGIEDEGRGNGIQLWQHNNNNNNNNNNHQHYLKKSSSSLDHNNNNNNLVQNQSGGGIGTGLASSSSATATCQDCGNQAKKDCNHRRCRTCCKSRGFDCNTHLKSTWVPAARRRERQLITATATAAAGSSGSTSGAKKPRLLNSQTTTTSHTSTSNTTPPRSLDTSSSHQDAGFKENLPGQVRAQAVFKCVRVTAVEDGEDEYAYQAVVKIGGHVFKGFLYDQGVEAGDAFPNVSELHLGDGSRNNRNGASSSCPFVDPSDVYNAAASGPGPGAGVGFLGGSTYGNQIS